MCSYLYDMRRSIVFLLFVLFAVGNVLSQIEVSSFRLLDNDLTANTYATMVKDQNGEVAALIKVVTPEQGFVFDGGMAGIVKTESQNGRHPSEIWVYVPHGIRRVTIQHPQLGMLRDHYFPIAIEKARTYEMVLKTPASKTDTRMGVFELSYLPAEAKVYFDGIGLPMMGNGSLQTVLAYGNHTYKLSADGYESKEGTFVLDSAKVSLRIELPKLPKEPVNNTLEEDLGIDSIAQLKDGLKPSAKPAKKQSNPYWRSLLVPGWGDKFVRENGRFGIWKTMGSYGLIGAGIGAHFYGASQYARYESMAYDNFNGITDYSQAQLNEVYDVSNTCRKVVPVLIGAGAAIWLYDVVWVAVKGHKSQNTELAVNFDPQTHGGLLSYSITF